MASYLSSQGIYASYPKAKPTACCISTVIFSRLVGDDPELRDVQFEETIKPNSASCVREQVSSQVEALPPSRLI